LTDSKGPVIGPVFAFSGNHAEVARFYRDVIGLAGDKDDDATWLEAANAKLVVHDPGDRETEPEVSGQRGFVVWFGVDDVRAAFARAQAAGALVGEMRGDYFFARDPDGRYVGVYPNEEHGHGHDHEH
jgi:predicted enzyme related to lactoylglutathione lyase